jgi:hypothetical protein
MSSFQIALAGVAGILLMATAVVGAGLCSLRWYFNKIDEGEREDLIDYAPDEAPAEDMREAA